MANGARATELSPLYLGPVADCDGEFCDRFENLWQYRKVYKQLGHWDDVKGAPSEAWHAWRRDGYERTKNGKGIRTPPQVSRLKKLQRDGSISPLSSTPVGHWWDDRLLDYVSARKLIYVPVYARLVQTTDTFAALEALVASGEDVLIVDLDGPPLDAHPSGMEVTLESLKTSLCDTTHPFGHGYVVAALLAGIDLSQLCSDDNDDDERRPSKKTKTVADVCE